MTPADAPPPQYLTERIVTVARPRPSGSQTSGSAETQVFRFRLEQPAADWLRVAVDRIGSLTALARDWDTYGAQPVEANSAVQAVQFLLGAAYPDLAPPTIVPLTDGGVQVEWHQGGIDIEVSFSDLEPGVYVADRESGETVEVPLSEAASVLARLAPRLAVS